MAKISVYDMTGAVVSDLELNDNIFGIEPNTVVMHAAVVNYLANQRQGTQSTLTRTEVSGGGKKPWRQKGTGHARQGSTRAPQWTHGGVALGPKPRSYTYSLNKKVKRLALKSALSAKVQDGSMIVVDSITADEFKTKTIVNMLKALSADKALIVLKVQQVHRCQGCRCYYRGGVRIMAKLAYDIILKPVITEKSMEMLTQGKYTFKVAKDSNKIEIAKAVEALFPGVKVAKVNTVNCRGVMKRMGRNEGYTPAWKKAVVTLAEGSKTIEFFDGMI